ncbi:MAG: FCD domain-containing protein [Acidaminobacter sp.]|uniref:FadR/GntR family transcriptional regulator n=1 Tax=Acidaminobacter sp. TaxID=1872102 RepID=UPI00138543AC|nr:FadR/GntR family transcriptional regulator [Acidaminobacter sp.]MZQ99557.1 FCD domain-containing protein [Acidaminobacter sp.]
MNRLDSSTPLKVAKEIIGRIEDNTYSIGDKLPSERELVKSMGISRSSVREGVKLLTTMGYVETKDRRGTFISSKYKANNSGSDKFNDILQLASVYDLMEVRLNIERSIIQIAAKRATADDIQQMKYNIEQLAKTDDVSVLYKADLDFHLSIAKATHNILYFEIEKILLEKINESQEYFSSTSLETKSKTIEVFNLIVQNIENKNIKKAVALYNEHLEDVESALDRLFSKSI